MKDKYRILNDVKVNIDEYEELLSDIDMSVYPTPTKERYHRIVDPMHGKLKSVYNK